MIQLVALMSILGFGIIISSAGSFKLETVKALNINDAKFGVLISVLMFSSAVMVLVLGILVDTFGHKPLAIAGFIIAAFGLALFVSTKHYAVAVLCYLLLGVGGMCICLVGNTLAPTVLFGGKNAPAAANLGNVFFGVGAFMTALIIGVSAKYGGYRIAGYVLAFVLFASVLLAITASYPNIESDFSFSKVFGLLTSGFVITCMLAGFFSCGVENSIGGWITSYCTGLGYTDRSANIILSTFWASMTVSRLVTVSLISAENETTILSVMAIAIVICIGTMIVTKKKVLALVLTVLIGLAQGPTIPTMMGILFSRIDRTLHGSAFGIFFSCCLLGASTIPASIGFYSKGKSLQKSLSIAMVAAGLVFVMVILMGAH